MIDIDKYLDAMADYFNLNIANYGTECIQKRDRQSLERLTEAESGKIFISLYSENYTKTDNTNTYTVEYKFIAVLLVREYDADRQKLQQAKIELKNYLGMFQYEGRRTIIESIEEAPYSDEHPDGLYVSEITFRVMDMFIPGVL